MGSQLPVGVRGGTRSNYDDGMDFERTALLIMDAQPEIVERLGDAGLTERLAERDRDQRLRALHAAPSGRPRLLADAAVRRLHRRR